MFKPAKIRAYLRRLRLIGETPEAVLSGTTVTMEALEALEPVDKNCAVLLFDRLAERTPGSFALRCGNHAKISDLGTVGYSLLFAPDLKSSFETWHRFGALAGAPFYPRFWIDGEHWHFEQTAALPLSSAGYRFCAEAAIASMVRLNNELADREMTLLELAIPFDAPFARNAYAELGFDKVIFNAGKFRITGRRNELGFPVAAIDRDAPTPHGILRAEPVTTSAQLRHLLTASERVPTLEMAAAELGMSAVTLHRRLKQEGASFRNVVAEFCKEYALRSLSRGCTGKEIAWRLGYDDATSFRRAFLKWTNGCGVRAFKRQRQS